MTHIREKTKEEYQRTRVCEVYLRNIVCSTEEVKLELEYRIFEILKKKSYQKTKVVSCWTKIRHFPEHSRIIQLTEPLVNSIVQLLFLTVRPNFSLHLRQIYSCASFTFLHLRFVLGSSLTKLFFPYYQKFLKHLLVSVCLDSLKAWAGFAEPDHKYSVQQRHNWMRIKLSMRE